MSTSEPNVTFEIVDGAEAIAMLDGIEGRAANPAPGLAELIPELEERERALFDSYHGKYVDTGATRDSLIHTHAIGAIREVHGGQFIFGTSIWYAKFQGTTGFGSHSPPSAILKLPDGSAELASKVGARYVVDGFSMGMIGPEGWRE